MLRATREKTEILVDRLFDLGKYHRKVGENMENPQVVKAYQANITKATMPCNNLIRRSYVTFRAYAYKEKDGDEEIFERKYFAKETNKHDITARKARELDDERRHKEQEKKQRERKRLMKEAKHKRKEDKDLLKASERKEQLEAYLLKLPTYTLLQSRRVLAHVMGLNDRYFDRHQKEDMQRFVEDELEDTISPDSMRALLREKGLPRDWLYYKDKGELKKLCLGLGIDIQK